MFDLRDVVDDVSVVVQSHARSASKHSKWAAQRAAKVGLCGWVCVGKDVGPRTHAAPASTASGRHSARLRQNLVVHRRMRHLLWRCC
eukprot:355449-Chlamydomonas_euryale.AAC.2